MINIIKLLIIISFFGNLIAFPIVRLFFNIKIRQNALDSVRSADLDRKKDNVYGWMFGTFVASCIAAIIIS